MNASNLPGTEDLLKLALFKITENQEVWLWILPRAIR